jgi:hypothetical protein
MIFKRSLWTIQFTTLFKWTLNHHQYYLKLLINLFSFPPNSSLPPHKLLILFQNFNTIFQFTNSLLQPKKSMSIFNKTIILLPLPNYIHFCSLIIQYNYYYTLIPLICSYSHLGCHAHSDLTTLGCPPPK